MARMIRDRTGERYGRLTVLAFVEMRGKTSIWRCRCECGSEKEYRLNNLTQGTSQSCGCLHRERASVHGMHGTRVYKIWCGMIQRCQNPNHEQYKNYGGRGIAVDPDWQSFESFFRDMGLPPTERHTLERKNGDSAYCASNCIWATQQEQQNNRRNNVLLTFEGKTQTISQWARELNLSKTTIQTRVARGWPIERVLSQPWSK